MILTCPNCDTNFSISQAVLGPRGRTVRCARCGHKWHAETPHEPDDIPLEMPPSADSPGLSPAERALSGNTAFASGDKGGVDFGALPAESPGEGGGGELAPEEDPFARISELMMASAPEPIPDVFATVPPKPAPPRKGAIGLWLLLVVLLAASGVTGLYFLQDKVIDAWPDSAQYYDSLGLRNEVVGAGLSFRNYNSERLVQDNSEVLIVRGVIANSTEQPREIPLLRLALYNNQTLLQEKIISPPQTALDAHGTIGFRITLDQPDPNASRFEVTFTAAKPPGMK